jgi:hypothetical protein
MGGRQDWTKGRAETNSRQNPFCLTADMTISKSSLRSRSERR